MSQSLIFGASGQAGSAFSALLGSKAHAVDRTQADLSRPEDILRLLDSEKPSVVVNAAAFTAVDLAEKETEVAFKINAEAPGVMAEWCAKHGVPFVHFSTDYVFPGTGLNPWKEEDQTGPLNVYGKSKLEGEKLVQRAGGKFLIFRTSWVYDAHGKNFLKTMLKLGAERETLRVVSDQIGAPTYAPHLAKGALQALSRAEALKEFPSGIYHLCNQGETSWHGFAEAIFKAAREKGIELQVKKIDAIASSDYPTPAKRPMNSRLSTKKAAQILGVTLPSWEEGLNDCMKELR